MLRKPHQVENMSNYRWKKCKNRKLNQCLYEWIEKKYFSEQTLAKTDWLSLQRKMFPVHLNNDITWRYNLIFFSVSVFHGAIEKSPGRRSFNVCWTPLFIWKLGWNLLCKSIFSYIDWYWLVVKEVFNCCLIIILISV